jgi:plasmid stabilization system protein ParE
MMLKDKTFKVEYTEQALFNAQEIVAYLKRSFSAREVKAFYNHLAEFEKIIIKYPNLFKKSNKMNIRRAVLSKELSVFYSIELDTITILAIIDIRWDENTHI